MNFDTFFFFFQIVWVWVFFVRFLIIHIVGNFIYFIVSFIQNFKKFKEKGYTPKGKNRKNPEEKSPPTFSKNPLINGKIKKLKKHARVFIPRKKITGK
jgi:hypothetical protein